MSLETRIKASKTPLTFWCGKCVPGECPNQILNNNFVLGVQRNTVL